ncbi:unnamed protein product [Adineta steineri]|uniref:peptidylprolyl isomerase n=1 Tax=Adineta steineri TaxID=433720 RepID=A0A815D1B2_9BILA|nr:unnamed protein product [Adineta steineri]
MTSTEAEKLPFKGEDISPDHDQGLLKEIVRQGTSNDKPLYDDQVFIHYVGSELDGKVFVNSRERDEKYSFSLGKGEVIPAWDIGVMTMKRGEVARFSSTPKYAYGNKGEKKYRSATNVIFEIELFDFNGKDISEEQDGSMIKRIIQRGSGRYLPNEDATVDIKLKGTYQNKIFDERTIQFIVGLPFLQNIPLAIDYAVRKMYLNEHCQLVLKGKALEGLEKLSIPIKDDTSIQCEITLIKLERLEDEGALSDKEKVEQSELLKSRADNLVKNNHYQHAITRYQMIVKLLTPIKFSDRNDRINCQKMQVAAQSNISLCYLKLGDHLQCKQYCDSTLALDGKNEKCLFRRGQTQIAFSNYELAIQDFQSVLKLNPSNIAAKQQIEDCQRLIKQNEVKKKESFKSFFSDTSRTSLFDVDKKCQETKEKMQEKNALRSLGLEPISLESLNIRRPEPQ